MADAQNGGVNLQFAWDDDKAASNLEKHSVSFEEAAAVLRDPLALIFDDEAHSIGDTLRIFSARPATRKERQDYERYTNL